MHAFFSSLENTHYLVSCGSKTRCSILYSTIILGNMNGANRKSETYVTQQPDGTTVTTTTKTQTRVKEEKVWRCGRGNTDKYYCMGPHGILRIIEIVRFIRISKGITKNLEISHK